MSNFLLESLNAKSLNIKMDKEMFKAAEICERAKEIRTNIIVDKYHVLILNGFKPKATSFHLGICVCFAPSC